MHDDPRIPLTFTGEGFEATAFTERVGIQLRPRSLEEGGSFQAREWPLGSGGILATERGEVINVWLPVEAAGARAQVAAPDGARERPEVDVQLPFGAGARVTSAEPDGDEQWFAVELDAIAPMAWVRLTESTLHVGTDAAGQLAALRFAAPVRRPVEWTMRVPAGIGWEASANTWFDAQGASGRSIVLQPAQPSIHDEAAWQAVAAGAPGEQRHEASLDGRANLVLVDGRLAMLDGQARPGLVELPEPDERVEELELRLRWPIAELPVVVDEERGRARFELDAAPVERWVRVGEDGPVFGIAADGAAVAIVTPPVQQLADAGFDPAMMDPMSGASQVELAAQAAEQLGEHQRVELARAEAFAAAPPFPAYGPTDPPAGVPVAMRVLDGPFGPGEPAGVLLEWGDHMARMLPDGDRGAPVLNVIHERALEHVFPESDMAFDEHLGWLLGEQMTRRHWAIEAGEIDPPEVGELLGMGPDQHERQLRELAERAEPVTLVVDGEPLDGELVRIDGAFVARARRDGWQFVVQGSNVADIPELAAVDDLVPFVAGRAAADERMLAWQQQAMAQHAAADPAPADAICTRDAGELLMRSLQGDLHGMRPGPSFDDARDVFAAGVVDAWGGPEPLRRRLELAARVAQLQGSLGVVARDGSVAQGVVRVHLPRPDGMGFGMTIAIDDTWWDHDADAVRAIATSQLAPDQQGDYELAFNVLLERQDDGSMRIATDVLRLLEEHVGGIERLLTPPR